MSPDEPAAAPEATPGPGEPVPDAGEATINLADPPTELDSGELTVRNTPMEERTEAAIVYVEVTDTAAELTQDASTAGRLEHTVVATVGELTLDSDVPPPLTPEALAPEAVAADVTETFVDPGDADATEDLPETLADAATEDFPEALVVPPGIAREQELTLEPDPSEEVERPTVVVPPPVDPDPPTLSVPEESEERTVIRPEPPPSEEADEHTVVTPPEPVGEPTETAAEPSERSLSLEAERSLSLSLDPSSVDDSEATEPLPEEPAAAEAAPRVEGAPPPPVPPADAEEPPTPPPSPPVDADATLAAPPPLQFPRRRPRTIGPRRVAASQPAFPLAPPRPAPEGPVPGAPNPRVAAALSAIIPGAGQFYCGQKIRGNVMFLIALFTCAGAGLLNVYAALDAWLIAERKQRGESVGEWERGL